MTEEKKDRAETSTKSRELPFVEVLPPRGTENAHPAFANFAEVSGGGDAITLDLYYVSLNGYRRAFRGDFGEDVEDHGDRVIIRSPPVASVILPMTLALQVMAQMYEKLVTVGPELSAAVQELNDRVAAVHAAAQNPEGKVGE